jgi:RNA polymerase sigma-70 factor (ECF subfamily)
VVETVQITTLLRAWSEGDDTALAALVPLVEAELRRLAHAYMSRERSGHTLQPTALVNETFLRLIDAQGVAWQDRNHFLGIAAKLMRRVLVDHARRRGFQKRGGDRTPVALDESMAVLEARDFNLLALDRALEDEIAATLGVSVDTVKRDWRLAKLWLLRQLRDEGHV